MYKCIGHEISCIKVDLFQPVDRKINLILSNSGPFFFFMGNNTISELQAWNIVAEFSGFVSSFFVPNNFQQFSISPQSMSEKVSI